MVGADNNVFQKISLEERPQAVAQKGDQKPTQSKMGGPRCTALFDFHSDVTDDLSFKVGVVIKLKERVNDDWLKGELNGKTGTFPAAYVEVLEDLPPTPSEPGGCFKFWREI